MRAIASQVRGCPVPVHPVVMHGCCRDKSCTAETCMQLPPGCTCGTCMHEERCCAIFGHAPDDTYCDWFPRRYMEARCVDVCPFCGWTGLKPAALRKAHDRIADWQCPNCSMWVTSDDEPEA